MKKIIYCCDGTWGNKRRTNTNVFRLYRTLKRTHTQVVIYDEGVGSEGSWLGRMQGGAFGHGLDKSVRRGYRKIAERYSPGDEIYLFGYSRGAFTARSITGMIAYCGLPTIDKSRSVIRAAFKAYRARTTEKKWRPPRKAGFVDPGITMLGLWDTVGTLGVPGALFDKHEVEKYAFHDTNLHEDVLDAYHALALDEKRRHFSPTLFHDRPEGLEQVWFSGDHGDVGGGMTSDMRKRFYKPQHKLSDIPFAWMLGKALQHGVEIDTQAKEFRSLPQPAEAALARLSKSWNPLWGRPKPRIVPTGSIIASSVVFRLNQDPMYNPSLEMLAYPRRLAPGYRIEHVI